MKLINVLAGLALGGCYVNGQATVSAPAPTATVEVDEAPPQPQYEAVVVRPGYVWIGGHWLRRGGRWVWRGGYYEPERRGYIWAPGRWEVRGSRHVWIEGGWRVR